MTRRGRTGRRSSEARGSRRASRPAARPPLRLARYMAPSACADDVLGSIPGVVDQHQADAGLHDDLDLGSSMATGSVTASITRPARWLASSALCTSSHSTTNSSPPKRATVSPARTEFEQAAADRDQDQVAGLVAVGVVGLLEQVQVDEHHRGHSSAPLHAGQGHPQPVEQQRPVGQRRSDRRAAAGTGAARWRRPASGPAGRSPGSRRPGGPGGPRSGRCRSGTRRCPPRWDRSPAPRPRTDPAPGPPGRSGNRTRRAAHPLGRPTRQLARPAPGGRRLACSAPERDQQIAGHPGVVGQVGHHVRSQGGVDEQAVGQGERGEPEPGQADGHPPGRVAAPAGDQHHGQHDHVAGRVGQGDGCAPASCRCAVASVGPSTVTQLTNNSGAGHDEAVEDDPQARSRRWSGDDGIASRPPTASGMAQQVEEVGHATGTGWSGPGSSRTTSRSTWPRPHEAQEAAIRYQPDSPAPARRPAARLHRRTTRPAPGPRSRARCDRLRWNSGTDPSCDAATAVAATATTARDGRRVEPRGPSPGPDGRLSHCWRLRCGPGATPGPCRGRCRPGRGSRRW